MHRQIIVAALLVFTTFTISSGWANADSDEQGGIPAYNAGPPAQGTKLPPIVPKEQLWGPNFEHPYQLHAYELAAKIRDGSLTAAEWGITFGLLSAAAENLFVQNTQLKFPVVASRHQMNPKAPASPSPLPT